MRIALCLFAIFLFSFSGCSAKGYSDLKKAFDAAHVRLVASGELGQISAVQPGNVYVQDCTATPANYPFPANPTGALKSALESRTVYVGSVAPNVVPPLINTTSNPPTGWSVTFVNRVFELIGAEYDVTFKVEWKYYTTSNAALQALYDGEYHVAMPNFGFGAFWNGTLRRKETFETTCSLVSSKLSLFVKSDASFSDLASLKAASNLRVVTIGAGSVATANALFPGSAVTDLGSTGGTAKTVFDLLRSGGADVSVDVNPFGEATTEGLRSIESNFVTSAGGMFRRDDDAACPTQAPWTPSPSPSPSSPSSSTSGGSIINVNFREMFAGWRG